ncbi:MAG: redoxin family protein [Pseudobutyrivibrio sp.]|nr:redoxin family protein [Pseudobutyrivibrio sp.]
MSISVDTSISVITVFIQGIVSFFSPCVLPLLPVYMGYLSGGTLSRDDEGNTRYDRKKVMINTLFFVIGVSFAFFLLGLGMSVIGKFFSGNQILFARVGGIIVIIFGLYQLGLFGNNRLLSTERRIPLDIEKMTMSPITAIVMGFVLSFAWSPCVGPALSSVLIMAASSKTAGAGFLLIGVYTLGYIIPFLFVGLFTTGLLDFFGKHRSVVKYAAKVGGILMIVMGVLMLSGKLNSISSYLSEISNSATENVVEENSDETANVESESSNENTDEKSEAKESEEVGEILPAEDFTLVDQYGNTHSLSDYKGKVVFLNFWATWCPPCREEMPYIQELYEEYSGQEDPDVVILAVAFPNLGSETDVEGIKSFLDKNGYTYPVLMDEDASLMLPYYVTAYPTTYMIDPDGNVLGYIPGSMSKETMEDVISQALELSDLGE